MNFIQCKTWRHMHSNSVAYDSSPITNQENICVMLGLEMTAKYYYQFKGWSIKHYDLLNQVISNG